MSKVTGTKSNNEDGVLNSTPLSSKNNNKIMLLICVFLFVFGLILLVVSKIISMNDDTEIQEQHKQLLEIKGESIAETATMSELNKNTDTVADHEITILDEYKEMYELNNDLIGWLSIEDTVINYNVMQNLSDENYYLDKDFIKQPNSNGCLIMDNDSHVGVGISENNYMNGTKPSTNLIIHGHTMKSGNMFGDLDLYKNEDYCKKHNIICFDSLYEKRQYEVIAVFYSQVYYQSDNVFKFYKFFDAENQEEFEYWYNNIKELSLYDTGVTAEFGDEFITLSCCAYHVEDGRFVVVGKRIQ